MVGLAHNPSTPTGHSLASKRRTHHLISRMSNEPQTRSTLQRIQSALGERYLIKHELGAGGMATVYLATDTRHGRDVAVKVLRPELAASLGSERFLREIQIVARLQHPHILMLIDSGGQDGFLFYVMPFFEGESLRQRLDREGQLPIDDAIQIARQVASALAYAHKKGVIHRDIKPGNILLSENDAMVADFGIARAISAAEDSTELTDSGIVLGTPSYISPEQIAARDNVDGRTDVYALGCVLYEMLAGEPPFYGSSIHTIMARHALDPVPPLRTVRPSIPLSLEHAINVALAKSPADRFNDAAHFSQVLMECGREISGQYLPPQIPVSRQPLPDTIPMDVKPPPTSTFKRLREVLMAAAFVTVILILIGQPWSARPGMAALDKTPFVQSVAVMPLRNLTGDASLEHLGVLFALEIIENLSRIDTLKVTPGTSVFGIRDQNLTARQISDTLGVRYVIDGYFWDSPSGSEVKTQLIDGLSGTSLWTQPFLVDLTNPQALASLSQEVSQLFINSVGGLTLEPSEAHLIQSSGGMAYQLGMLQLQRRTPDGIADAVTSFSEAILLDSMNVHAFARLATTYGLAITYRYNIGVDGYQAAGLALNLSNRAIELDSNHAIAYSARAYVGSRAHGPIDPVVADFRKAQELAPNAPAAGSWFALLLDKLGRPELALREAERAITLDPLSPSRRIALALQALKLNQTQMAIDASRAAFALQDGLIMARAITARALLLAGRAHECLEIPLGPHAAIHAACLFEIGRTAEATAVADSVETALLNGETDEAYTEVLYSEDLAAYYAWMGDVETTILWMRRSFALSPSGIETRILESPLFARVRGDERFESALAEILRPVWPRVLAAAEETRP